MRKNSLQIGMPSSQHLSLIRPCVRWKFSQINLIYFATTKESLADVFRKYDCASCILLWVDELIRKAREALATAKNRNKLGGE